MLQRTQTNGTASPLELAFEGDRSAEGRPWVAVNFVTSIDGATALEGGSTKLGDDDDRAMFQALRAVPDVILVGASTVIVEDYGPVTLDRERREARSTRGLADVPKLAIVSGTMSVDAEARVFSDQDHKPLVITGPNANPGRLALLGDAADVEILLDITPEAILASLAPARVVLLEGGPSLTGQFLAAGLVDEMNLTISPIVVGGDSKRVAGDRSLRPPAGMALDRVVQGSESLFLRYLKKPA